MATPEVVPVLEAVVEIVVDDKLVDNISMECRWSESGEAKNRIVNQAVYRRIYSSAVCVRA